MRIGVIGSTGGSAFKEAYNILETYTPGDYEYLVLTDRPCGLEDFCALNGISHARIETQDNTLFSTEAKKRFDEFGGLDFVLLYFTRLVTKELFRYYPTYNIHQAALPAFKGLGAVKKALKVGVRFFGTTLHLVNAYVDGGAIIAQVSMPVTPAYTEAQLNKLSFIHKVYLSLLLVELVETVVLKIIDNNSRHIFTKSLPYNDRCNPAIKNNHFLNGIFQLQKRENAEVIV